MTTSENDEIDDAMITRMVAMEADADVITCSRVYGITPTVITCGILYSDGLPTIQ
jgi:hypothetical protein